MRTSADYAADRERAAAKVAQEAWTTGKTVREICRERKVLDEKKLAEVLDPRRMTEPE